MPVESSDYKEIQEKNKVIHNDTFIKAKDLIIGATYEDLNGCQYVYMCKSKPWKRQSNYYRHKRNIHCYSRYSSEIIESVSQLICCHDATLTPTKPAVKRLLNKLGEKQLRRLLVLRVHDIKGQSSKDMELRLEKVDKILEILDWIIKQSECFQLKDLAINGNDLIEIGIPEEKLIGQILNLCLSYVIDGTVNNTKNDLLKMIDTIFNNLGGKII